MQGPAARRDLTTEPAMEELIPDEQLEPRDTGALGRPPLGPKHERGDGPPAPRLGASALAFSNEPSQADQLPSSALQPLGAIAPDHTAQDGRAPLGLSQG
eukprot:14612773-Alexandrium_andersonii.AAC.1